MRKEDAESARDVIRAIARSLSAAKDSGLPPDGMLALLDAARRAVPKKSDPHPCTERCWRIGAAADIDERGKCMECGHPGVFSDSKDFVRLCTPEAVVAVCEAFIRMREILEYPALLAAANVASELP